MRLSCLGKIIMLPGQLNLRLSCPGKIIILPGQINEFFFPDVLNMFPIFLSRLYSQKFIILIIDCFKVTSKCLFIKVTEIIIINILKCAHDFKKCTTQSCQSLRTSYQETPNFPLIQINRFSTHIVE